MEHTAARARDASGARMAEVMTHEAEGAISDAP